MKTLARLCTAVALSAALLLVSGVAFAQVPGLPSSDPVPTLNPTPATNIVDDLLDGVPDPRDPTGVNPPGTDVITDPIKDLLPPGTITDPGTDPGGGGGGGGGSGTRTTTTSGGAGGGSLTGSLTGGSGSSLVDSTSGASDAARLDSARAPFSLRVAAGRALRLAMPLAAPIAVAVAGVLGLVMLAKSNGRLDGLNDEKEALGGWTVIRL